MPEISDERIQQMKDALAYCGWEFKWEDESGIVFDTGRTDSSNRPPAGTRYDYGLYETGTDRVQFQNWEQVQDMIDKAIYYSVEEVADATKENYTKEHNGVALDGQELEEAMYPERFDGGWEQLGYDYVYIPNPDGKWSDVTEIDLSDAHFSGNTMTYEGVRYNLDKTFFYATEEMAMDSLSEDGMKKDVHMVNARLQIDGETGNPYYVINGKDNEFPPQCFAVDSETHKLVMIQAGEKGTFATPIKSTNAVDNQVLANKLNARYGVSKEQASEMLYCAKNGWDKETRESWAEQKDNITPEQTEINEGVKKAESILVSGEQKNRDGNISWELNKDGTLTISGAGWFDENYEGNYPWTEYRDVIKNVVIEDGIENIPCHALENCHNLKDIEFPSSIKQIGIRAFAYTGLEGQLILPENARIETSAFKGCKGIDTVYGKGNTFDDLAIFDCGVKEIRLNGCTLKKDSIYKNYELDKIVSKNSNFEENSVSYNLNLNDVVTENDHGIEAALRDNGYTPPKVTAIDSNDKEKQGGKYNIGKESIFGHIRRRLHGEKSNNEKNAPSRENQQNKTHKKSDHAME